MAPSSATPTMPPTAASDRSDVPSIGTAGTPYDSSPTIALPGFRLAVARFGQCVVAIVRVAPDTVSDQA